MALYIRDQGDLVTDALVSNYNLLRRQVALTATKFHRDATSTQAGPYDNVTVTTLQVTAANGSGSLPILLTLCANLISVYNTHRVDAVAHLVADTTNTLTTSVTPTDLTTAIALLNDLKAKFNAHLTQTGVHVNDDSTNTVVAADATSTQGQADTLANAIKSAMNAHISNAPLGSSIVLVVP